MNEIVKSNWEVVEKSLKTQDAENLLSDPDIRRVLDAKTADEIVAAISTTWKKTKFLYVFLGKRLADLEKDMKSSKRGKEEWISLRLKLQTQINNGTISHLLALGKGFSNLAPNFHLLPDDIRSLKMIAENSKSIQDCEQKLIKVQSNYSNKNEKNVPKYEDYKNVFEGKSSTKRTATSTSSKSSLPSVVTIKMSDKAWEDHGDKLVTALDNFKDKWSLNARSFVYKSKE